MLFWCDYIIDLGLLQSVSYIAAAIGVCVAATYYIMTLRVQQENLKETIKNRRATFSSNILQTLLSEEGMLKWIDLLNMQWTDFDDYVKKYDSSVNRDNFGKRTSYWNTCEFVGYQYKSGAIDLETIQNACGVYILQCWIKFKPIIERYREWEWPRETYSNWEHLANDLEKVTTEKDKNFRKKFDTMVDVQTKPLKQ